MVIGVVILLAAYLSFEYALFFQDALAVIAIVCFIGLIGYLMDRTVDHNDHTSGPSGLSS